MIRLRALEREDLKQLRDWRNDPEIFSRVREYRYLNMENQEVWFNSLRDNRQTIMLGIETEKIPQEVIEKDFDYGLLQNIQNLLLIGVCGLIGIDWVGRKAEVSIYIGDRNFRGKGLGNQILDLLAKYAFEECNLNRLWAEIFTSNSASHKVFIKAGYSEEGLLRNHAYKNGFYQDSFIFGLLREEWQKTVAP